MRTPRGGRGSASSNMASTRSSSKIRNGSSSRSKLERRVLQTHHCYRLWQKHRGPFPCRYVLQVTYAAFPVSFTYISALSFDRGTDGLSSSSFWVTRLFVAWSLATLILAASWLPLSAEETHSSARGRCRQRHGGEHGLSFHRKGG